MKNNSTQFNWKAISDATSVALCIQHNFFKDEENESHDLKVLTGVFFSPTMPLADTFFLLILLIDIRR